MESVQRANRHRTTGFASPAEDFFEKPLDVNDLVVFHPSQTYLYTVCDSSMAGLGILPGDRLLIDRAIDAAPGRTLWVQLAGETAIKRLQRDRGRLYLSAGDADDVPLELPLSGQLSLEGVVTTIIRRLLDPKAVAAQPAALQRVPDLNMLVVANPTATFFSYVSGTSMVKAGIYPGDVLVVDRSLGVTHGTIVIAVLEGSLTIKRMLFAQGHRFMATGDPDRPLVEVGPQTQLQIWGVATYSIHSLLGPFPHVSRRPPV
jgi:SOS-response transcriptional repressor LexA